MNFWKKLKKPTLALAPMAGITDRSFRAICRKNGADVTYSEMASVSALFFKPERTLELVRFTPKERPYVVQLFGKEPAHFAKATQIISEIVRPDGIDINFGCPAKKVFGHGSGCALMPQKELARDIISAVIENTSLPVSLKIRAGLHPVKSTRSVVAKDEFNGVKNITALEFIENVKDIPFSAVMVHGRTYEGSFSSPVDFEIVEKIKKIIPDRVVLGNGGIMKRQEAVEILEKFPLIDGLGIARGAWGQPWIFDDIKKNISSGKHLSDINHDLDFIKKIALEHARLIIEDKGSRGIFEIRKHLVWYFKGFPGASELRQKLVQAKNLDEIQTLLNK